MSEKTKKMYSNPPKAERDEKGKLDVKETEKSSNGLTGDTTGDEGVPVQARHAMERRHMEHRHEDEHMMHEAVGKGDKSDMHQRHLKERGDMYKRHEKEWVGSRITKGDK